MRFFLCNFNKNDGNRNHFLCILSVFVKFFGFFSFHISQKA